jgi:hypothetical protein
MAIEYLRVKIKSLAAEATIIRHEEVKAKAHRVPLETNGVGKEVWETNPLFFGLRAHRVGTVRNEARTSLIAYAFLRQRNYKAMETIVHVMPDWAGVHRNILRFGGGVTMEDLMAWSEVEVPPKVKGARRASSVADPVGIPGQMPPPDAASDVLVQTP